MAHYTFSCQDCGEFTEWHKSTKGNKKTSDCPTCYALAKRVFTPPIIYRMDSKLKNTIASGMEPVLTKKKDLPKVPIKNAIRKKSPQPRPWQVGNL